VTPVSVSLHSSVFGSYRQLTVTSLMSNSSMTPSPLTATKYGFPSSVSPRPKRMRGSESLIAVDLIGGLNVAIDSGRPS